MHIKLGRVFALGCILFGSPHAYAATQGVQFNATVAAVCVLTVGTNGTMTVGPTLQTLSSQNSGGSNGTVGLATTGGVTLSVDSAVTGVSVPAGDTAASITWSPTYATTGAHTLPLASTARPLAGPGVSTVQVHLLGTKTGTDTFVPGAYQATVTVRCEP